MTRSLCADTSAVLDRQDTPLSQVSKIWGAVHFDREFPPVNRDVAICKSYRFPFVSPGGTTYAVGEVGAAGECSQGSANEIRGRHHWYSHETFIVTSRDMPPPRQAL